MQQKMASKQNKLFSDQMLQLQTDVCSVLFLLLFSNLLIFSALAAVFCRCVFLPVSLRCSDSFSSVSLSAGHLVTLTHFYEAQGKAVTMETTFSSGLRDKT